MEHIEIDLDDIERFEVLDERKVNLSYNAEEISKDNMKAAKMFAALAKITSLRERLEEEKKQCDEWFDGRFKTLNNSEEYLKGVLELAANKYHLETGEKSIKTYRGTATVRNTSKIKLVATNKDDAVIAFAKRHNLSVKTVESANLNEIKKKLSELSKKEWPSWAKYVNEESVVITVK